MKPSQTLRLTSTSVALIGASLWLLGGCSSSDTQDGAAATSGGAGPTSTATTGPGSGTGGAGGSAGGAGGMSAGGGGSGGIETGQLDCSAPSGAIPPLKLTEVASNLSSPVLAKSSRTDPSRLYIVERGGAIKILKDGAVLPTAFLDIGGKIKAGGEQGLLGLAFHPDYENNGRFFVYYSAQNWDMTVAEYKRSADPDVAEPDEVGIVISRPDDESNHNGGSIEFSPMDGFLYIFWGDGGGAGDQHGTIGNGQDLGSTLGKVLRIDVKTLPYAIPAGNMTGDGVAPEIWDYGVRNPFRSSFDGCTADLYIGDVGQGAREEVDVEPAGMGQNNYGWRLVEGTQCYESGCDPGNGNVLPVVDYDHGQGQAIIGGYVYRGSAIPALRGTYFYGDNGSGHVWSFSWSAGQITGQTEQTEVLGSNGLSISSFGQDAKGEVYLVDLSGSVYRIDAQ